MKFDREEITDLANALAPLVADICLRCGPTMFRLELTPDGPHYAKHTCVICGKWCGWVPKPDTAKVKRPAAHRELVQKFSKGFCEMCLTQKEDLPARQVLEGHHVKEFAHAGEPTRDNVWVVCSACHKLIHLVRNYYPRLGKVTA